METVLKHNETYIPGNILNLVKPFSVIEWHCNIAEYSYANHDDHPHIHKKRGVTLHEFHQQQFFRKSRVQGDS